MKIVLDWNGLRTQASQINSNVVPAFSRWKEKIESHGSEAGGYSSDFSEQVSVVLHETAKNKVANVSSELSQFTSGLNATADIHEDNEENNTQGIKAGADGIGAK